MKHQEVWEFGSVEYLIKQAVKSRLQNCSRDLFHPGFVTGFIHGANATVTMLEINLYQQGSSLNVRMLSTLTTEKFTRYY